MKMPRPIVTCIGSFVLLSSMGCRRGEEVVAKAPMISSEGVMIVDEVCTVTQGYRTEGQRVTVRGSLNAPKAGGYALFNSQWDPFDPEAGKDIPRIAIRFRSSETPDDQLGWYVDVTGIISTERHESGKIEVTLDNATIEPGPTGKGEAMTPRK